MKALELFMRYAPNKTFIAVFFGSSSGIFYALLIPVVMIALSGDNPDFVVEDKLVEILGIEVIHSHYALLFIGLCICILVFQSLSEVVLARVALNIRFHLRKDLYRKIKLSPIAALEQVGSPRLIQALLTDVNAIVNGAQLFPLLVTNLVTLTGMLGYLAYLDYDIFVFVMKIILFGIITYQIPVFFGTKLFHRAREHQDLLQEAFKGLVEGAKELKLSLSKQRLYEDEVLLKQEKQVIGLHKQGQTLFSLANNYGRLICFFAIGSLSFIFINYHVITNNEIIAAVMVLLYVTGPIGMILNFIPELSITRISLKKVERLYEELPEEKFSLDLHPIKSWHTLRLHNIKYQHRTKSMNDNGKQGVANGNSGHTANHMFEIGPISLMIKRGQITFIAGGNGSGKSTLSKVISQHYLPIEGDIYYDDVLINENNLSDFREQISCIYSDYYLFDKILDINSLTDDYVKKIEHYLEAFGLKDKVKVQDGHFSTLKLSDGQRRRLALVVAIAEDKSLYVFDEWAADQDPMFKQVFYREILPDLKGKNKAIVVISHDDRYFDVADQLLVMESGKLSDL